MKRNPANEFPSVERGSNVSAIEIPSVSVACGHCSYRTGTRVATFVTHVVEPTETTGKNTLLPLPIVSLALYSVLFKRGGSVVDTNTT